jgi:protocatechuate 3,4-dioxygenase beta subunit
VPGNALALTTSREPGTPIAITGTLVDKSGFPVGGAEIHVYHADARGWYTPRNAMDEPNARLSGRLRTDANGRFELRTIRPGHYPRPVKLDGIERRIPAHIHMDITAEGHAVRRLQMVFADDSLLAEPYWKDWVAKLDQPVLQPHAAGKALTGTVTITLP